MRFYAGIGSRQTPDEILSAMTQIATCLHNQSWVLRSGHAPGADLAFEAGAGMMKEIMLPWPGFNGAIRNYPGFVVPEFNPGIEAIAKEHHPNWKACSSAARLLHMRNVCQVLGSDCRTPVDMVVCWTPKGSGSGGTGQAIRIANGFNIPVFDLGLLGTFDRFEMFLKEKKAA